MKNKIGLAFALLLLGYGIIRIGVGTALLTQHLDIIAFSDLADATKEVEDFIDERSSKQLVPFTAPSYFTYILVMGILLTAGSIGVILRQRWGFIVLWVYIASHAALFINFRK